MEMPAIVAVMMGIGFFILACLWREAYEEIRTENEQLRKEIKILHRKMARG